MLALAPIPSLRLQPIFASEFEMNAPFIRGRRRKQRGIALAELALAVALTAVLYMSISPLIIRSEDVGVAKSAATDYTAFRAAASAHFLSNRGAYDAAMKDGTGAAALCKVGVAADGSGGTVVNSTTMHRCAVDASMFHFLQALPSSVSNKNRYGETWVAIFKQVYDTQAVPAPTGAVEMYIVSARVDGVATLVASDPRAYEEAITASGFVSGQGGVVPDADRSTCVASRAKGTYQACGSGWKANLADFLESGEVTSFASRLSN